MTTRHDIGARPQADGGDLRPRVGEEVLAGMTATAGRGGLVPATCLRHLRALGAAVLSSSAPASSEGWPVEVRLGDLEASCMVARTGDRVDHELAVQAASGLMAVHGRQLGRPVPLGVELAEVTTAVVAVQGLLACLLGQIRGGATRRIETSSLESAVFFLTHYFAAATCGDDWQAPAQEGAPAPPLSSSDGDWFELEALTPDAWNRFWRELGVTGPEVGRSWRGFVFRYVTATCRLHPNLVEATAQRPMREIAAAAAASGVSICRLRPMVEVAADFDAAGAGVPPPWEFTTGPAIPRGARVSGVAPPIGLPLAGVRVVEVTRRIQGPFASQVLRLLGAEVTRVEQPGGDPMRMMPPLTGDSSARFMALNRGKAVREIDIKDPDGRRELIEDLVIGADVFLHNWAPGRAEAMGLDFAQLAAAAPQLVYGSISGWGRAEPPWAPAGTDYAAQAHAGLGETLNPPTARPFPSLLTITDVLGALIAAEGILAALLRRERTGRAARVDTSLYSAAIALQAHLLEGAARAERDPDPGIPVAAELAALPADPDLAPFFELVGGCRVPAAPWRFSA
jgi:crotonobetainyl-CoA:carnitine CoA-transferase CaiB-like acyl-CoA transferase